MFQFLQKGLLLQLGRLLRFDIVHFHFTCLGTEIFLQEPVAEISVGGDSALYLIRCVCKKSFLSFPGAQMLGGGGTPPEICFSRSSNECGRTQNI